MFGHNEIAPHLMQAIVVIPLALFLMSTFRRHGFSVPASIVPVVGLTVWFLAVGHAQLGLIELTAGVMIFAAIALIINDDERRSRDALAGLIIGIVMVAKVILGVLCIGVILAAIGFHQRRRIIRILVSASIPVSALVIWAANSGVLVELLRTTFVTAPAIAKGPGLHTLTLANHIFRTSVGTWGPFVPLAVVGLRRNSDRMLHVWRRVGIAWLIVGVGVVIPQRWNFYQADLFAPAIWILATVGLENLLVSRRATSAMSIADPGFGVRRIGVRLARLLGCFTLVLSLLPLALGARKVVRLSRHEFGITSKARRGKYLADSVAYRRISLMALPFSAEPRTPISLLGDPLIYFVRDFEPAIALTGFLPQQWTPDLWAWWTRELQDVRPAEVFVDNESLITLRKSTKSYDSFTALYRQAPKDGLNDFGVWWVLK